MSKNFVHLHMHSEYSVLDGILFLDEIIDKAVEYNMPAVALTDHGNLFGVVEFYKKAKERGVKPIIGMETYLSPEPMESRNKGSEIYHLTLLAENMEGYENLLRISTESYLKGFYYKPRVDKGFLKKYAKGLIALSGCLQGELSRKILLGYSDDDLNKVIESYLEIFGKDSFYLELQDVGFQENRIVNRKLLELASRFGLGTVATNDVHFLKPEDRVLQEVMLCIQTGTRMDDPKRMKIETDQIYFKSSEEMWALFGEFEEPLLNTLAIAERVNVELDLNPTKIHLPHFEIPEQYEDAHQMLAHLAWQGLKRRIGENIPDEYKERLDQELKVIRELNFSMYFLIIWDLVAEAKRRKIPVGPGRGSAVGSLALYALGVTEVDPLRYNLIFERFLNPERVSPPDVDIDFSDNRRDEMIKYLREKYGENNVAQIISFGRAKAKQAIKDVARVLGLPYSDSDRIAKTITENTTLPELYETNATFRDMINSNSKYKDIFSLAIRIEGRVRNISTHAAGVVVAPVEIYKIAPLYRSEGEEAVTVQFDMKSLELLGLLKIDLLGLRTLTIIQDTVEMIRQKDPSFSLEKISLDDSATYEMLSRGDTTGVFQLESEGFRATLRRLKPSKMEDLVAALALYRPGPMRSGMLESFIRRKNGEERVEYVHDKLKDLLSETYGVIAYQEQVMLLASSLAGFSLGEADLLRKAMGKKQRDVMEEIMSRFVDGCVRNGIEKSKAEVIFNNIAPFAEYGFNKSHAAGYGILAYYTAFLKAHYPLEFIVANLNAEMNTQDSQEKIYKFLQEAKKGGFKILPASINKSAYKFKIINDDTILIGLGSIKNVGRAAVDEIIKVRSKLGGFKSINQFLESVDTRKVNKKTLESLVKAGAFDEFHSNRKSVLASINDFLQGDRGKGNGIGNLFGDFGLRESELMLKELPYSIDDRVYYERESFGFYLTAHPLEKFPFLAAQPFNTVKVREELLDGDDVVIVGVIVEVHKRKSRNNEIYANVKLWDLEGEVRCTLFPQLFKEKGELIKEDSVVIITGKVSENGNDKEIRVEDIAPFDGVEEIEINLTGFATKEIIDILAEILRADAGGKVSVKIIFNEEKFTSEYKIREEKHFLDKFYEILPSDRLKAIIS
ncbi:MAG TPA: DNA polymerase III subunit alpha [Candidatus Hydrothermia bacterium]|nr:DNA polymerase III subunit alpha [Candidatus Hydrothermia bacterium]